MRLFLTCVAALLALSCGSKTTADYAGSCQHPRTGIDPYTGKNYPDRQGSMNDEKSWLRLWTNDLYLWYREVPSGLNPDTYPTPIDYFNVLKTRATTPSGKPKDQFHFTYDTAVWNALQQSGAEAGYGAQWALVATRPPRKAYIAYTEPSTPATQAGLTRGVEVVTVDGVAVVDGDPAPLNAGLFPAAAGESHTFGVIDRGATTPHDVTLKSAVITSVPVQNVHLLPGTTVGYMLFNSFDYNSEKQLSDAITTLKAAGATDLIMDMRYNGGGLVAVASELGYMIAAPSRTANKTFEKLTFNDKSPDKDPVTGEALTPIPFYSTAAGFTLTAGQALPHFDLDRVFILTGSGTASASESVINALLGVDENVMLFGATTRGKPYGFYPFDNCGTTYFSIQFEGQNAKGFGEYSDGFIPGGGGPAGPPGCPVADDFLHELGDPAEARLAAALGYRTSQTCPAATGREESVAAALHEDFYLGDNPFRQNRIYLRPRR